MKRKILCLVDRFCFFSIAGLSWQVSAFDDAHLRKLQAGGSCPGCDFSEADLDRVILAMAN